MGGTWWTDSEQLQLWGKSFSEAVWAVNVLQGLGSVSLFSSMSWRWPSEVLFLQLLYHTVVCSLWSNYRNSLPAWWRIFWHLSLATSRKTPVTVLSRPREWSHLKLVMQLGQVGGVHSWWGGATQGRRRLSTYHYPSSGWLCGLMGCYTDAHPRVRYIICLQWCCRIDHLLLPDKQSDLQKKKKKRQLRRCSCHISPRGGWFHLVTITLMS